MADQAATTPQGVAPVATAPEAPQLSQEERIAQAFAASEAANTKPTAPDGTPAPAAVDPNAPAQTAPDTGPEIRSLKDLTKFLNAQEDDVMNMEVDLNVDGQVMSKPLRDVIKGYQLDAHNTQKSQELSALRQQQEADFKAQQEAGQAYFTRLIALGTYAQELINNDFKNTDWAQLQAQDPIGYVTKRQEFTDRQNALNAYLGQAQQQAQTLQAQAQQRQQAQVAETVRTVQAERPEWRDMTAFNKDCDNIKAAVLKAGLPAQDLPFILSHPAYLRIADAATRYFALQAAAPAIEKRVNEAPKFVKPGTSQPRAPTSKAQEALKRVQADPKNQDKQAAAFEALLG